MPAGRGTSSQIASSRRRTSTRRSGGLSPTYIGNQAFDAEMRRPYSTQGTGLPRGQVGPDPMELFLRTQQELNAVSGYPGGDGGGGGGSGGRRGGGGGGRGGGGGGGGGAGAGAAYTGQLAGIDESLRQLAMYYGQQQGTLGGFAEAARQRAIEENKVLAGQIAGTNKASEAALAQRTAAINQILAGAGQQRAMFDDVARRDLEAQGIGTGGYDVAAKLEQGRMGAFSDAQRLYGADIDANVRAGNQSRSAFAGQSQRDALSNITASEQMMLSKLSQQRLEAEAELVRQRAQIRAEAAAAGVKV